VESEGTTRVASAPMEKKMMFGEENDVWRREV
jgi:hypothetical protein